MVDEINSPKLMSIHEASLTLGVSEAALRQWTDEGRVKAFITPGGHRRYSAEELKKLSSPRQKTAGLKDFVTGLESSVDVHRELDRASMTSQPWFIAMAKEDQDRLARNGREMLALVSRYVAEPAKRDEAIDQARQNGAYLGETLARAGLPLTDSCQVFIAHRDPLIQVATRLIKQKGPASERLYAVVPLVARIMDEALLGLVAAHQEFSLKEDKG